MKMSEVLLFVYLNTIPGCGKTTISVKFIKFMQEKFGIYLAYFSKDDNPNYLNEVKKFIKQSSDDKVFILIDRNWPISSLSKLISFQKELNATLIGLKFSVSVDEQRYISFRNIIKRENHVSLGKDTPNDKLSKILKMWYNWDQNSNDFFSQFPIIEIKHVNLTLLPSEDVTEYIAMGPDVNTIIKYKDLPPLSQDIYCFNILTSEEVIREYININKCSANIVYIDPKQHYLSAVLTKESCKEIQKLVGFDCKIKDNLHCTLAYNSEDIIKSPYINCIGQTMSFTTGDLIEIINEDGQVNTIITYSENIPYHITLLTNGKYKPIHAKFAMLQAHGDEKYVFENFTTKYLKSIEIHTIITAVNKR
jgi:hypothetical protein